MISFISETSSLPLNRDRRTLKDALVEFFAKSKGSSRILRVLSAKRKPVRRKALMDEIRFAENGRGNSDDLPASAIRAALYITLAAGLVRLTRHGFSITEAGREVQRRIEPELYAETPNVPVMRSISGNGRRAPAALASSDQAVLRDLQKRERTLIRQ